MFMKRKYCIPQSEIIIIDYSESMASSSQTTDSDEYNKEVDTESNTEIDEKDDIDEETETEDNINPDEDVVEEDADNITDDISSVIEEDTTNVTEEDQTDIKTEDDADVPIEQENKNIRLLSDNSYVPQEDTESSSAPSYQYSDETYDIAEMNSLHLNSAIEAAASNEQYIRLETGIYPVIPSIILKDCVLDLNGSILYNVEYQSNQPLIVLSGENSCVKNGEIVGSYDRADDESGYAFWESEALIATDAYHYTKASVENCNLHNCWGYAIRTTGGVDYRCPTSYIKDKSAEIIDNETTAWTISCDVSNANGKTLKELIDHIYDYKYIVAYGGYGYSYIISDSKIKYSFYDKNGDLISECYEVPRIPVEIPDGMVKFTITTYDVNSSIKGVESEFRDYFFGVCNYKPESFTISNCKIHNNSSLGCANFDGNTYIYDTEFYEQGKPRHSATMTKRNTIGAIDIEDVQTPYLYMENCDAHNDRCLLMDGSYEAKLQHCIGRVSAYRGWNLDVSDHVGYVGHSNVSVMKWIYVNGLYVNDSHVYSTIVNPARIVSNNITSPICNALQYYNGFVCHMNYTTNTYKWNNTDSAPNGTLYGDDLTSTPRLQLATVEKNPYTGVQTNLKLIFNMADGRGNVHGSLPVSGDCYYITSNTPVLPNGHVINRSTFNICDLKTYNGPTSALTIAAFSGGYNECEFTLKNYPFFRSTAKVAGSNPVIVTFEQCNFHIIGTTLFDYKFPAGSIVTFINCELNGDSMIDLSIENVNNLIFSNSDNVQCIIR